MVKYLIKTLCHSEMRKFKILVYALKPLSLFFSLKLSSYIIILYISIYAYIHNYICS